MKNIFLHAKRRSQKATVFLENFRLFSRDYHIRRCHDGIFSALICESALEKCRIRRAERSVCGKLYGSTGNKGSRRHDNLIRISGHIPRLGRDICVNRRTRLDSAAKSTKSLRCTEAHRLNDIMAFIAPCRLHGIAELIENLSCERRRFLCLSHCMRSVEKALEHISVLPYRGAAFRADADCRLPV